MQPQAATRDVLTEPSRFNRPKTHRRVKRESGWLAFFNVVPGVLAIFAN